MIGKFCVVRTYSAGVHVGTVQDIDGRFVLLVNARRVWRWRGARTLNELANHGASKKEHTRISEPVERIQLTEAIEIILCTTEAQANLEVSRWL